MRIQPNRIKIAAVPFLVLLFFSLFLVLTLLVLPLSPMQKAAATSSERVVRQAVDRPEAASNAVNAALFGGSATIPLNWLVIGSQPESNFGVAVAYGGDIDGSGYEEVIVGADLYDGTYPDQGQVSVYYGTADGPGNLPGDAFSIEQADAGYGRAVAAAGDVNNDGFADMLSGAPYGGPDGAGLVFVDYGSTEGLTTTFSTLVGQMPGDRFGFALAAGDINGNGYTDVIVGAPGYQGDGIEDSGAVFLYYGGPTGVSSTPGWVLEEYQLGAQLGYALAVGDFNDDGFDDIAIGAKHFGDQDTDEGMVVVFYGSEAGPAGGEFATIDNADWIYNGEGLGHFFGAALAAGDVTGNGADDLIVGAPGYGSEEEPSGILYGFFGSEGGLDQFYSWYAVDNEPNAWFGTAVAVGDLNNNGQADVIAGAPFAYPPDNDSFLNNLPDPPGVVYVYLSHSSIGPNQSHDLYLTSEQAGSQFGFAVAANDNGAPNVLVGAPQYESDGDRVGAVFGYALFRLTATNSSPTNLGDPTSFAAFLEDGRPAEFEWDFGDGNTAAGQFVAHTYEIPREYTAVVTATTDLGSLTASTTVVVNVNSEIDPETGGTLDYLSPTGWGINVFVPGGAVERRVGLAYNALNPAEIEQPLPPNASTYFFDLDPVEFDPFTLFLPLILNDTPGNNSHSIGISTAALPDDTFPFLRPITVTVTYTDDQIRGLDEETLTLTYWDGSEWPDAATTCDDPAPYVRDPDSNRFTLQICHLSRFGMVGN